MSIPPLTLTPPQPSLTKKNLCSYIGIPVYLIFLFGYKIYYRTKTIKPHEADLFTGKAEIDREEAEFLAQKEARSDGAKSRGKFYRIFISWLF
jgi:amino acid transporter